MRVSAYFLCVSLLVACEPAKPPTTSFRIGTHDAPDGARVTIDDEVVGSLATVIKRGVALPPGKHRVTIEANGYLPFDAEVDAGDDGGLLKLDVTMRKMPE